MFYKLLFEEPVEYQILSEIDDSDNNPVETQVNQYTGYDSVIYSNSQIDILLNDNGEVDGLQICSECTKTFDIESHLLNLALKIIENTENRVEVFDGSGFTEIMDTEMLKEYSES